MLITIIYEAEAGGARAEELAEFAELLLFASLGAHAKCRESLLHWLPCILVIATVDVMIISVVADRLRPRWT